MNAFCGGLVGNTSLCLAQFVLLNGNIKHSKVLSNMAKYADLDSVHVLGVGCGLWVHRCTAQKCRHENQLTAD